MKMVCLGHLQCYRESLFQRHPLLRQLDQRMGYPDKQTTLVARLQLKGDQADRQSEKLKQLSKTQDLLIEDDAQKPRPKLHYLNGKQYRLVIRQTGSTG